MERNFRIASGVELVGEFGRFDLHNDYDLDGWEVGEDGRIFRMVFRGNEHRHKGRPAQFKLDFTDVSVLELTVRPEALSDFVIEEVGFKEPDDRDYSLWSDDYGFEAATHLVFHSEDAAIRVCAKSAVVSCRTASQPQSG
jgi:hypothetical protein